MSFASSAPSRRRGGTTQCPTLKARYKQVSMSKQLHLPTQRDSCIISDTTFAACLSVSHASDRDPKLVELTPPNLPNADLTAHPTSHHERRSRTVRIPPPHISSHPPLTCPPLHSRSVVKPKSSASRPKKRFVGTSSSSGSKTRVPLNQIPQDILDDKELNEAIATLPSNYNFEVSLSVSSLLTVSRLAGDRAHHVRVL